MKHIFLLLSFCITPIMAMDWNGEAMDWQDCFEQEEPNLGKRGSTIKIDERALRVPPKKARIGQARSAVDYEMQHKTWNKCAKAFDAMGFHIDGYLVFANKDLMQGAASAQDLRIVRFKLNFDTQELCSELASNYKIHLMPFDEDIVEIMRRLLQHLTQNNDLQRAISHFKIHTHTDSIQHTDGMYLPIMVIYCHANKDAAQYVLNEVHALFKHKQGLNITPRYNRKITSLIYYAQGDGDRKDGIYSDYYEEGLVHYHPKFEGVIKDYWLDNPAEMV
jgi:hypothetical protein